MKKKLFKHGGSYALDLPVSFVRELGDRSVTLEARPEGLLIRPAQSLDTIEGEPEFKAFAEALLHDALRRPGALRRRKQVWDAEWDELLKDVPRARD